MSNYDVNTYLSSSLKRSGLLAKGCSPPANDRPGLNSEKIQSDFRGCLDYVSDALFLYYYCMFLVEMKEDTDIKNYPFSHSGLKGSFTFFKREDGKIAPKANISIDSFNDYGVEEVTRAPR